MKKKKVRNRRAQDTTLINLAASKKAFKKLCCRIQCIETFLECLNSLVCDYAESTKRKSK